MFRQLQNRVRKLENVTQPGVTQKMEEWVRQFAENGEPPCLEYSPAAIAFLDAIVLDEPVVEKSRRTESGPRLHFLGSPRRPDRDIMKRGSRATPGSQRSWSTSSTSN